ncbi:acyl-CoA dehydrogenase family protein [Trebonia sp.]|uniref:acyl-CoA dehydrogenase family protein n=1 Tax=Trebonia sp. TaxID=2767075 RepID=UPI0026271A25|nr:acyl-CoA dehydrogenase family protein [Trebonia sp.]
MPSARASTAGHTAAGPGAGGQDVAGARPADDDDGAGGAVPVLRTADEATAAARAYAESIADGVIERDRAGASAPPVAELAALDASGLLAITVPRAAGGPELGATVLAEVVRTIAAVDPSIAQVPQGHFLFVDALAVWGSPEQQQRLFGEVLRGARLGNAQAERGGLHAQDLKTRLRGFPGAGTGAFGPGAGAGPSWPRLHGRKYYTTGSLTARWIGVTALDDSNTLVLAFVRRDASGVHVDDDWNVMGQRATVSGSATFDDVPVDPGLVVPYARAFEVPQQLGARSQLVHAAIQAGIARGALNDAGAFVRTKARPFFEAARAGWAHAASEDPHTIYRYGELATKVSAAEALLASAAATLDEVGRVPAGEKEAGRGSLAVAQAKAFASDVAAEVAGDLFSLSGASATDEKYDLSRHWRNARTHASHDPVAWKYHHVGNFLLNDVLPPNHGQL